MLTIPVRRRVLCYASPSKLHNFNSIHYHNISYGLNAAEYIDNYELVMIILYVCALDILPIIIIKLL